MTAGFNGARLHQKVFDERFHYWADRLGYLTWGEFASWGVKPTDPVGARNLLTRVGRGGRARPQPPVDHRLDPVQRDAAGRAEPGASTGGSTRTSTS